MKILTPNIIFAFLLLLGLSSCNPDCESYTSINAQVDNLYQAQNSLAFIRTVPVDFLKDRTIYIRADATGETAEKEMTATFNGGGTVVTIPDDLSVGAYSLLVDDPDCGGKIALNSVNIVDGSYFTATPDFIVPSPPMILIPNVPITPPVEVINAWFSPDNRDYCIWFKPQEDEQGNELPNLVAGDPSLNFAEEKSSFELRAPCAEADSLNELFHDNPVSGIIDKENNYIYITIDRSGQPGSLGVENYWGVFIDGADLPAEYRQGGACNPDGSTKGSFMLLTSEKTGKQLILYRQLS